MRLLHLADLHIGKILNGYSMLEDQRHILAQVLDIVDRQGADVVLIAGDIYDRSIAPKEALTLYNDFLAELILKRGLSVIAISGNHDSGERLEAGSALTEAMSYYMEGTFKKDTRRITLKDEFGEVDFYPIAFADVAEVRLTLEEDSIRSFDEAMQETVERIELRDGVRSVALAHCYAVSQETDEEEKIDSQKPLSIGGKDFVKASYFSKFNYTALGHLHRRQKCLLPKIRYCGTLLKYSFSEETHTKSVLLVDLDAEGNVSIIEEEVFPLRNMRTIRGRFEEVLQAATTDVHKEDYVRFILEDEELIHNAMSVLKSYYPYAMELRYEFREREAKKFFSHRGEREKTVLEMASLFYEQNYEEPMDELTRDLVREVVEAIGGESR